MREANELAAAATEHVAANIASRHEGKRGRRDVGGPRPRRGRRTGAAATSPGLVGPRHPHLHGDRRPSCPGERADAARDLGLRRRLLVRPHEERVPGRARRPRTTSCSTSSSTSTTRPSTTARDGASLPELDRARPRRDRRGRLSRASRPIRSATASARAPTSLPTRTRRDRARSGKAWCSRSSPGSTGRGAEACDSRTTS